MVILAAMASAVLLSLLSIASLGRRVQKQTLTIREEAALKEKEDAGEPSPKRQGREDYRGGAGRSAR